MTGMKPGSELARTTRRRLFRAAAIANGSGALDAFLFLAFLVPISGGRANTESVIVLNAVAGVLYVVLGMAVATRWANRRYEPVARWLEEERPPTDAERDLALRQPRANAEISAVMWGGAAVAFTLLNITLPAGILAVSFVTLILGGMTTAAVDYLLAERILRPVIARALAAGPPARPVAPGVSTRLLIAWTLATGVPVLGVVAVGAAQLAGSGNATTAAAGSVFLAGLALFVGLFAIRMAARSVAEPVGAVRDAMARVEAGDLAARVAVDDASEVGLLESGFNRMASGLEERERLRDLFGRHVGEDVARAALEGEVSLGGEEREIAALFVDLVGSTRLAARCPPAEVVELLNRFFRAVVETVEARGGFVNKFEGDAALCVFGAPVTRDRPAGDALGAGRTLSSRLRRELPDVDFGLGVSAGVAVAGNVGAEHRYEYTVIGDPVNEAARLCELAKEWPERVLASEAALRRAGEEAGRWRLGEPIVLRGRDEVTRLATVA